MKIVKWLQKRRRILLICGIILILFATLIPGNKIPPIPDWTNLLQPDKIVHMMMFTVLQFLLLLNVQKYKYSTNIIICFAIGLFLVVMTEVLQGVLPINRHMNIYDMIANAVGLIIGFLLWEVIMGKSEKKMQ